LQCGEPRVGGRIRSRHGYWRSCAITGLASSRATVRVPEILIIPFPEILITPVPEILAVWS
jgi:hypothetical protein